jgi:hypothetical protein
MSEPEKPGGVADEDVEIALEDDAVQPAKPSVLVGGGADVAAAYVPPTTLPKRTRTKTLDVEKVRLDPKIDPRAGLPKASESPTMPARVIIGARVAPIPAAGMPPPGAPAAARTPAAAPPAPARAPAAPPKPAGAGLAALAGGSLSTPPPAKSAPPPAPAPARAVQEPPPAARPEAPPPEEAPIAPLPILQIQSDAPRVASAIVVEPTVDMEPASPWSKVEPDPIDKSALPSSLGSFPSVEPTVSEPPPRPPLRKSKLPLAIGGAAVGAVGIGLLWFALGTGPRRSTQAAQTATGVAAAAAAPASAAPAATEAAAQPSAAPSADEAPSAQASAAEPPASASAEPHVAAKTPPQARPAAPRAPAGAATAPKYRPPAAAPPKKPASQPGKFSPTTI